MQNTVKNKNHKNIDKKRNRLNITTDNSNMHMEKVNCNDNWRNSSYWEEFQVNNPEKATEVIALGIDPDTLSDKDVKEVIFAI